MAADWELNNDKTIVTLTIDGTTSIKWDAEELDDIIGKLGEMRGIMQPQIPNELTQGQKVQLVIDPIWRTEPDPMEGNTVLHFRDHRFGWLHYMIPKAEAAKLAGFIQKQVDSPPPATPSRMN